MKDDIIHMMGDDGMVFPVVLRRDILVLGPDTPRGCLRVDFEKEEILRCDVGRKAPVDAEKRV